MVHAWATKQRPSGTFFVYAWLHARTVLASDSFQKFTCHHPPSTEEEVLHYLSHTPESSTLLCPLLCSTVSYLAFNTICALLYWPTTAYDSIYLLGTHARCLVLCRTLCSSTVTI